MRTRIFLLSPAHCGGKRAALLFRPEAPFDLALRLRHSAVALGEVFSFISGLYFRGKMAYSRRFARGSGSVPGALVITAGRGLVDPAAQVTIGDLEELASVPVDVADPLYREPLEADLLRLHDALPPEAEVILLGSLATGKYIELLVPILGDRLHYPEIFAGMGDMQRGAVMLRAAESGEELAYSPLRTRMRRPRASGVARRLDRVDAEEIERRGDVERAGTFDDAGGEDG